MQSSETLSSINLPTGDAEKNLINSQEWVKRMPNEEARTVAQILLDNINYVSFKDFTQSLMKATKEVMEDLHTKPYIIVFPQKKHSSVSSEYWVGSLAQMASTNSPLAYMDTTQLPEYLEKHPHIKDIVYYDDASYSGMLGSSVIEGIEEKLRIQGLANEISLHAVFSYATKQAIEKCAEVGERGQSKTNLTIHVGTYMPTLADVLENYKDKDQIKEILKKYFDLDLNDTLFMNITLTYFEHKGAPDFISFPEAVKKGLVRDIKGRLTGNNVPFIPEVTPPYRK